MKDDSCPTCGSRNFGAVEMEKKKGISTWKKHCYSCRKFWYA